MTASLQKYSALAVFLLISVTHSLAQIEIPVAIHILRDDDGNNPRATFTETDNEIASLNAAYNYLNITFTKCSEGYIDDDDIWDQFDDGDEDEKLRLDPYSIPNVVNVFFTDLEGGGHGKAVFPYKQKDWVAIDFEELNTTTIVHEFGHYFGLRHTYSGVDGDDPDDDESLTIRDAEGAEGWKYGDYLIDTPLDPENRSDFDNECVYIGDQRDANDELFHPDGKNYMGKGHNYCRERFSPGQEARIVEYIKRYRYYLECNNTADNNLYCTTGETVSTFPDIDDFDRADANDNSYWVQARNGDDTNWRNGPSTSSSSTGPDEAHSGETFMFIESSLQYTSTDEAILLSPCYDFTSSRDAKIEFYYHMYGSDIGTLELDITTDGGSTWTNLFLISGEQHDSGSDPWTRQEVVLDPYIGQTVQLRFKATSTDDSKSDIAIDQVTVSSEGITSSIDDISDNAVEIYPNPTNDTITIEGIQAISESITIYNALGQDVTTSVTIRKVSDVKSTIDLSKLGTGVYSIQSGNVVKKVYKQ